MTTIRQSIFWNRVTRVLLYLAIAVLFILVVFPFYWMIVTSLQPQDAVFHVPPQFWPRHVTFQNYIDAWNTAPWRRYFGNAFSVAVAVTLISLVTSSLARFSVACIAFTGNEVLFDLV